MQNIALGQESPKVGFGDLDMFSFVWNKDRETCSSEKKNLLETIEIGMLIYNSMFRDSRCK